MTVWVMYCSVYLWILEVEKVLMFTGIIEEVGQISSIEPSGDGERIEVLANLVIEDTEIGSSISIDGCCLTVVDMSKDSFVVEAVPETISRTRLDAAKKGDQVNMERALSASGRFGGHIVQGHVDGLAKIVEIEIESDDSWKVSFTCSSKWLGQIVEKGSITLNGVSLTVAGTRTSLEEDEFCFEIALIPHTIEVTTFKNLKVGDSVNLEVDVIARYVESLLFSRGNLFSRE